MAAFEGEAEQDLRKVHRKKRSSSRRSSILKPSKSPTRNALSDLDPNTAEENETGTKKIRKSRRVSFAETCLVKEFMTEPGTSQAWPAGKNGTEENLDYPPIGQITGLESLLKGPIQSHTHLESGPKQLADNGDNCPVSQLTGNLTMIGNTSMDITQCYLNPPSTNTTNFNLSSVDSRSFLEGLMNSSKSSNHTRLFDMTDHMELTKPLPTDIQNEQRGYTSTSGKDSFSTSRNVSSSSQFSKWDCTETKVYGPDETCLGFGEKTHIFLNENTGIMDLTSCVGGGMAPNDINRTIGTSSTSMNKTKLFSGNTESGEMELTVCIGSASVVDSNSTKPAPAYNVGHFAPECFASPVAKVQARSFLSKLMGQNSPIDSPNLASARNSEPLPLYRPTSDNKVHASDFLAKLSSGDTLMKNTNNSPTLPEKNSIITDCTRLYCTGSDSMDLTGCVDPELPGMGPGKGRSNTKTYGDKTRIFSSSFDDISRQMDFTECVANIDICYAKTPVDPQHVSPALDKENISQRDIQGRDLPPKPHPANTPLQKENSTSLDVTTPCITSKDPPESAAVVVTEYLLGEKDRQELKFPIMQSPTEKSAELNLSEFTSSAEMQMVSCVEKSIRIGNVTETRGHQSVTDGNHSTSEDSHIPANITLVQPNKTVLYEEHSSSGDMEITCCVEKKIKFGNLTTISYESPHEPSHTIVYNNVSDACNMEMTECIDKTIGMPNGMEPGGTKLTRDLTIPSSGRQLHNDLNLERINSPLRLEAEPICTFVEGAKDPPGGVVLEPILPGKSENGKEVADAKDITTPYSNVPTETHLPSKSKESLRLSTSKAVDKSLVGNRTVHFDSGDCSMDITTCYSGDSVTHPLIVNPALSTQQSSGDEGQMHAVKGLKRRLQLAQHSNLPAEKVAKFDEVALSPTEYLLRTRVEEHVLPKSLSIQSTNSRDNPDNTRVFMGSQDKSAMMDFTECQGGLESDQSLYYEDNVHPVKPKSAEDTSSADSKEAVPCVGKPHESYSRGAVASGSFNISSNLDRECTSSCPVLNDDLTNVVPGRPETMSSCTKTPVRNVPISSDKVADFTIESSSLATANGGSLISSSVYQPASTSSLSVTASQFNDKPLERKHNIFSAACVAENHHNDSSVENKSASIPQQSNSTARRRIPSDSNNKSLSILELSGADMSLLPDRPVMSIPDISDKTVLTSEDMQLTRMEDPTKPQCLSPNCTVPEKTHNKTRLFGSTQDKSAVMDLTECHGGFEEEDNSLDSNAEINLLPTELEPLENTNSEPSRNMSVNVTSTSTGTKEYRRLATATTGAESLLEEKQNGTSPDAYVLCDKSAHEEEMENVDEYKKPPLNVSTRSRTHSNTSNKSLSILDLSKASMSLLPKTTLGANSLSCLDEMANHSLIPDGGPKTLDDYLALLGVHFHDQPTVRWSTKAVGSVKSANSISEKLQEVVPELEVQSYQWACDQMSLLIDRYQTMTQEMSEQLMASPPAIFTEAVSDPSLTCQVQKLHLACCKKSKMIFKKWRMKMIDGLLQELKEEQENLDQANEEMSVAVESAELSVNTLKSVDVALDGLISSITRKKEELEKARGLSGERKSLSRELQLSKQAVQETEEQKKDYIAEEKNLKSQMECHREELGALKASPEGGELPTDSWTRVWDNVQHLKKGLKYEIESWNEKSASFTFLYGFVRLKVKFGNLTDKLPLKIVQVEMDSSLEKGASPLVSLAAKIVLTQADSFQNPSLSSSPCSLQQVLHQISLLACAAEDLLHDLEFCDLNNDLSIDSSSVSVIFSHLKAHAKFVIVFDINPLTYPWEMVRFQFRNLIGTTSLVDVQQALTTIQPGYSQLRTTVLAIEHFLTQKVAI